MTRVKNVIPSSAGGRLSGPTFTGSKYESISIWGNIGRIRSKTEFWKQQQLAVGAQHFGNESDLSGDREI